jgi:hypothetical protein
MVVDVFGVVVVNQLTYPSWHFFVLDSLAHDFEQLDGFFELFVFRHVERHSIFEDLA